MKTPFRASYLFGYLLNLLLPGAGHFLWKEVLFGLFVFLIMLLAAAVFVVHYLVSLPPIATWLLLGLPLLFYLFTFVDLHRTMSSKRAKFVPRSVPTVILLAAALLYQVLAPSAPANFLFRNSPDIFVLPDSHLNPLYRRGDLVTASRLAYTVDIPFLKKPLFHNLPRRFELVRFKADSVKRENGFVIGLPGEDIEMHGGHLLVNGSQRDVNLPGGFALTGEWPLTQVSSYSILVATFNLGAVDRLQEVHFEQVVGRIDCTK